MKTSYCLATIAVLAAIAGAVYTGLTAAAKTPPGLPSVPVAAAQPKSVWASGEPPALPPIVVDPDVSWPVRVPAKAASRVGSPTPAATLAPAPHPRPVEAAAQAPRPLPVEHVTLSQPLEAATPVVAVPAAPTAVIAQPAPMLPTPQPALPPPAVTPPPSRPAPPLPTVPPPVSTQPVPKASPALPAVPPPVANPPQPKAAPVLPAVPPPTTTTKKSEGQPSLPPPTPLTPPSRPSVGRVVLLQDGKIVEGTVAKDGDKVIVRRGVIDQPFEKDKVQFIGESKDEAYLFLAKKVKPDDADGRFKLARWCVFNGLREQALAEAREVVRMQPAHSPAKEMVRTLEESIRLFNADGSPTGAQPPAAAPATPAPGLPAVPPPSAHTTPQGPTAVVEQQLDLSPEAVLHFGPKVQPILVNLCAECHAKVDYAGSFKLACGSGHNADSQTTRYNLVATINQVNRKDPAASPLLVKGLSIHGGMKRPAFVGPQATAYQVLAAWVNLAAGPRHEHPAFAAPAFAAPPSPAPVLPPPPATPTAPALPPPIPPASEVKPVPPAIPSATQVSQFGADAPPQPVASAPNPASTDAPVDEFDPSVFNRATRPR